jgi:hypothetical protein
MSDDKGWVCPKCDRANAPWKEYCQCAENKPIATVDGSFIQCGRCGSYHSVDATCPSVTATPFKSYFLDAPVPVKLGS